MRFLSRLSTLKASAAIVALASILTARTPARAGLIIATHNGDTDPLTEGFGTQTFGASSTFGPLSNDLGLPAWKIAGTAQSSEFGYSSPALTAAEQADIASQGFTLTLVSRVLQNGLAPAYDSTNHVIIGGALVNYNGRRWELELGLDSSGDTVAVLVTSTDSLGPGGSVRAQGPNYTLSGSGSSYHTYDLVYNPVTQLADLFVDGVDRIQGYGGHTNFVFGAALSWSANSGGEANVHFVQLETSVPAAVPEPSSLALFGLGCAAFALGWHHRRCGGGVIRIQSG